MGTAVRCEGIWALDTACLQAAALPVPTCPPKPRGMTIRHGPRVSVHTVPLVPCGPGSRAAGSSCGGGTQPRLGGGRAVGGWVPAGSWVGSGAPRGRGLDAGLQSGCFEEGRVPGGQRRCLAPEENPPPTAAHTRACTRRYTRMHTAHTCAHMQTHMRANTRKHTHRHTCTHALAPSHPRRRAPSRSCWR